MPAVIRHQSTVSDVGDHWNTENVQGFIVRTAAER